MITKGRKDPTLFINQLLGLDLHKGQLTFIDLFCRMWLKKAPRRTLIFILTCANRWGKSVTISCIQLWFLFYKVGVPNDDAEAWSRTEYRTANIAPHSALTEPVFKTMHQILTSSFSVKKKGKMTVNKCLIEWWYMKDRTLNTPPYKQVFDNGAYIEHRSLGGDMGDALQGKPYGVITYDEGGRSDHLEQEINDSIIARLFDMQGPLFLLSTPSTNSKSSIYYYQMYKKGLAGIEGHYTMTGSLRDNEFFSKEQIQAQYDLLADNPLRDQMLEGKFVFGGNTMFDSEKVLEMRDKALNDGIRYEEGHHYVVGVDTAIGSDECVYSVIDVTSKPFRQVRELAAKGNSKSPTTHMWDFENLVRHYWRPEQGNLTIMLETYNGESVRFYHDMPEDIKLITETFGTWSPDKLRTDNQNEIAKQSNTSKKPDMLISLRKLIDAYEIKIPENNYKLIDQLAVYTEDDKKLQQDRVIALALAVHKATKSIPVEYLAWESVEW
jgi:hypothetical protein